MRETWPTHLNYALGMTVMALGMSVCFKISLSRTYITSVFLIQIGRPKLSQAAENLAISDCIFREERV